MESSPINLQVPFLLPRCQWFKKIFRRELVQIYIAQAQLIRKVTIQANQTVQSPFSLISSRYSFVTKNKHQTKSGFTEWTFTTLPKYDKVKL